MSNLVNIYRNLYLDSRRWLRLVFIWFAAGTVIGGLTFFVYQDLLQVIFDIFSDKFGDAPALDFNLVEGIFLNNVQASAIALFGGLLVGLGPFLVVVSNGFILGYILVSVTLLSPESAWQSLGVLIVGILPHGIIEIPAFLFAGAIGLGLGIEWLKQENYGHRKEVFKKHLRNALIAIPIIVVSLFIAALIEVYLTGNLLDQIAPR
ncbi:MAG TPA: stage II sporulation protein M [Verrucomicrobiae bacterium]|nr:stage II sporulation protein M [Verrucomicrobiae bacterium]